MSVPSVFRAVRTSPVSVLGRLSSAPQAARRYPIPLSSPSIWPVTRPYSLHFDQRQAFHNSSPLKCSNFRANGVYSSSQLPSTDQCPDEKTDNSITSNRLRILKGPPIVRSTRLRKSSHGRFIYTGRLHAAIEKPRTKRIRYFSSSAKESSSSSTTANGKEKSKDVTWREALKSPRKAITYTGQLRRDLVSWAKHMWTGGKLLAADVRVSTKILRRVTGGKQITRRERNFIVQTGVDLARLVPFTLFLIIPLAEFALPFALRLFPHMLPSQFQDQMKEEEKLKKRLKARLELAKYLRQVVEEKAKFVKASDANSVSSNPHATMPNSRLDYSSFKPSRNDSDLYAFACGKTGIEKKCRRLDRIFGCCSQWEGCLKGRNLAVC